MSVHPWVKSYPSHVRWNAPLELSSVQSVLEQGRGTIWPAAGARLHEQAHDLRGARRAREPRRGRLPEARRQARRACRPLPPQHASLRHRLFRRAEGGRRGRQLLAPGRAADAPTEDRRQRDRHPRQSRPRLALSASRETARFDAPQNADRRRIRRDDARARGGQSADDGGGHAGGGQARRAPRRVPRSHRQRRRAIGSTRSARSPTKSRSSNIPAAPPVRPRARC